MVLMELTAKWVVDSLSSFRSFIHSNTQSSHPDSLLFLSLFFQGNHYCSRDYSSNHLLDQTLPTWVSLVPRSLSECLLRLGLSAHFSDFLLSFPLLIVLYSSLSALVSLTSRSASDEWSNRCPTERWAVHLTLFPLSSAFPISLLLLFDYFINSSNSNGSYYYSNPNGSTYYNDGKGSSTYTSEKGNVFKK